MVVWPSISSTDTGSGPCCLDVTPTEIHSNPASVANSPLPNSGARTNLKVVAARSALSYFLSHLLHFLALQAQLSSIIIINVDL